jgi:hypothetical protein
MTTYQLTDKHYSELSYFIPELHQNNLYNLDKDPLIDLYDRELFIKVLDYYKDDNLDFINKENYKEYFKIFLYFGSDIGILFDCKLGIVVKELNILKNIDSKCNIINKEYYKTIINFNKNIYNEQNKNKYQKFFDLYFDIFNFDINILDHNKYYVGIYSIKDLKECTYCDKIKIFFNDEIKKDIIQNNIKHIIFHSSYNGTIEQDVLPKTIQTLTFEQCDKEDKKEKRNFTK